MNHSRILSKGITLSLALFALSSIVTPSSSFALSEIRTRLVPVKRADRENTVSGSLGLTESMGITADEGSTAGVKGNLDFKLYKSISVGVEGSYKRPYGEEDPNYDGWGDVTFYLVDRELYKRKDLDFNISAQVGYVIPVSARSRKATLEDGYMLGTKIKKGFDGFNVVFSTEVSRYFFEYDTSDAAGLNFNSPYGIENGLSLSVPFKETWKAGLSSSVRTIFDYSGVTYGSYQVGTSLSWEFIKNLTASAGLRSTRSDRSKASLFDAETTSAQFGLSLKF